MIDGIMSSGLCLDGDDSSSQITPSKTRQKIGGELDVSWRMMKLCPSESNNVLKPCRTIGVHQKQQEEFMPEDQQTEFLRRQ